MYLHGLGVPWMATCENLVKFLYYAARSISSGNFKKGNRLQSASFSIGDHCGGDIESGRAALVKGAIRPDMHE